jgi:2-haloacid dehalogenase
MAQTPSIPVFDFGGVLLDWNPRYLFRKLIPDADEMEHFLAHVCSPQWNSLQDAGRSFAEGVAVLTAEHPQHASLIRAYHERWDEMVTGAFDGTVEILATLKEKGVPLYGITNFAAETLESCYRRFDFFGWFDDVAISAKERVIKPEPQIYRILLERNRLDPADTVFIDDVEHNVEGARRVGMHGIHFKSPEDLRRRLQAFGIL